MCLQLFCVHPGVEKVFCVLEPVELHLPRLFHPLPYFFRGFPRRIGGRTIEDISEALGVSTATLSRRLSYLRHNEGALTKYRELQHLRVSDLSAKVLDSLKAELPEMETDQRIKLLGVLIRSEAQFKERDQNTFGLMEIIYDVHKKKEKVEEKKKEEAIEIENLNE